MAPDDPEDGAATARGTFLGDDTSDPAAKGVEIYSDPRNLPTANASILGHTQNRANFHPASMTAEELLAAFKPYTIEIDKTPFFALKEDKSDEQKFYSKDYNVLIDQVVSLYDGASSEDQSKLKNAIADMAKSVFGQERSEKWKNLFSQSTLDMNSVPPTIMIYYTSLHMSHDSSGKSDVNEQSYIVKKTSYFVLTDLIVTYASQLAGLDKQSVDDWLTSGTSPEVPDPALCFDVLPYKG